MNLANTANKLITIAAWPISWSKTWDRPFQVLFSFWLAVLVIDSLIFTIYVSYFYGLLVFLLSSWIVVIGGSKTKKKIEVDESKGCYLGIATDLENPKKPRKFDFVLQDKTMNLGMLIVGAPGAGKTYLMVFLLNYISVTQQKYRERLGWLYNEGKGDAEIYQMLVGSGAKPDRFFSSELPESDSMNLFLGETNDVVDRWTRILIDDDGNPYYVNAQKRALQSIVPLMKGIEEKTGRSVTLRDLFIVLRNTDAAIEALALARSFGVNPQVIGVADEFFEMPTEERSQLIGGMLNRLFVFVNGPHTDRINSNNPTLNLEECVNNNMRVYNHLPLTDYSKNLAFVICEELGSIARTRQNTIGERTPFQLFMDDWGGFFYDGFGNVTARVRSAQMPVHFAFQSKGQMDKIDLSFAGIIDDTVSTKIFLRLAGVMTRRWASEMMGTYDDVTYNVSDRVDDGLDGSNMGEVERPRVRADEFRRLHDGEAVIQTLSKLDGGLIEALDLKLRFPLVKMEDNYKDIQWPKAVPEEVTKEGLGFWDKYMSDDLISEEMLTMQWEAMKPKNELLSAEDGDVEVKAPISKVKDEDAQSWDDDEELFN